MANPILVSGIQPTGRLHLGNYLGALKNFVDLQNSEKYQGYFFIADYHAITAHTKNLTDKIADVAASYVAAGLDSRKSVLYAQSRLTEHTELAWILNSVTSMGDLNRMTQFKDKSSRQSSNAGLFTYPVLMAADILLYDAEFVPTGTDQDQHVELTRTIARSFNNKYGETFVEPKSLYTKTPNIKSLDDPSKKMSKTLPKGCLYMDDSEEEIEKKVKTAVTDSGSDIVFDQKKKPAVSNLLQIYSSLSAKDIESIEESYKGKGYADFKNDLVRLIADHFSEFRTKKESLMDNRAKLAKILSVGEKKARKKASQKLREAKEKVFSLK